MARNREVELKFLIDQDRPGLEALPALAGPIAHGRKVPIETIYYDTAAKELESHGLTVRLRKTPQKRILSVKSSGGNGIGRREREVEIRSPWPSAKEWKAVTKGSVLAQEPVRRRLKPLCTTTVDRVAVDVEWKNATIETSLDEGKVKAKSGEIPIHELELEIKKGRPRDLFSFAQELLKRLPLRISLISKGTRGALLANDQWACPQPASLPEIKPEDDGCAAFQKICMTCLRDFMINEVAIAGSDPVEGVHKTRIAVRRLRSAMTLFQPALNDADSKMHAGELKWLSDVLGHARDLDVTAEKSGNWTDSTTSGMSLLTERLKQTRLQGHQELGAALRSRRCRSFLFNFVRWLEIGKWRTRSGGGVRMPISKLAGKLLRQRLLKLLRDAKDLAHLPPEELHEFRKDAKKLRYMSEFFLSLVAREQERKGYRKLLQGLEDVQKALGTLQDQATLEELARLQIRQADDDKTRAALKGALKTILASTDTGDSAERKKAARAVRKIRAIKPVLCSVPLS